VADGFFLDVGRRRSSATSTILKGMGIMKRGRPLLARGALHNGDDGDQSRQLSNRGMTSGRSAWMTPEEVAVSNRNPQTAAAGRLA
jgi:hypothetical protein